MLSLGLASFFSVGALLKSSAGSTLSQLLYFPAERGGRNEENRPRADIPIRQGPPSPKVEILSRPTDEVQAHDVSTHRGHLEANALALEGAGVLVH